MLRHCDFIYCYPKSKTMKRIRKIALNPLVILSVCMSVLVVSCSEPGAVKKQLFTGQEIYQGIFFGQGPLVEAVSSLKSITRIEDIVEKTDPMFKQYVAIQDLIITTIEKSDEKFFDEFQAEISSGDHLAIQESISKGARKYLEAVNSIANKQGDELKTVAQELVVKHDIVNEDGTYSVEKMKSAIQDLGKTTNARNQEEAIAVVLVVLIAILVILAAALADVYAVAVNWEYAAIWEEVLSLESSSFAKKDGNSLFRDQLVSELATAL